MLPPPCTSPWARRATSEGRKCGHYPPGQWHDLSLLQLVPGARGQDSTENIARDQETYFDVEPKQWEKLTSSLGGSVGLVGASSQERWGPPPKGAWTGRQSRALGPRNCHQDPQAETRQHWCFPSLTTPQNHACSHRHPTTRAQESCPVHPGSQAEPLPPEAPGWSPKPRQQKTPTPAGSVFTGAVKLG